MALVGVGLGTWLGYFFSRRETRAERLDALFDEAESAIYELQAARHYATDIPDSLLRNEAETSAMVRDLRAEGLRSFVESAAKCRQALARLQPHCEGLRDYWDRFELSPEDADAAVRILRACRSDQ